MVRILSLVGMIFGSLALLVFLALILSGNYKFIFGVFISLAITGFSIWAFRNHKPFKLKIEDDEILKVHFTLAESMTTGMLILIMTAIYGYLLLNGKISIKASIEQLYLLGAGHGQSAAHGEYWRYLAAIFLHATPVHIISNILGLWAGGRLLNKLVGSQGLLVVFFLGGLAASITSSLIHPQVVSVGASGAIFAVYGAIISFLFLSPNETKFKIPRTLIILISIQVLAAISEGFINPIIDNAAHVGGLLAGLLGVYIWNWNKDDQVHRATVLGVSVFILTALVFLIMPRVISSSGLNPVTLIKEREKIVAAIGEVEKLETEYFSVMKGPETSAKKSEWIVTTLYPKYKIAVTKLQTFNGNSAANKMIAAIYTAVAESAPDCLKLFQLFSEAERLPAGTDLFSEAKARSIVCNKSLERRSEKILLASKIKYE